MTRVGRIGLVQLDGKLPNLALMRLATYYRRQGAEVSFPYDGHGADQVFASTVFTGSRRAAEYWASVGASVGGTGWDLTTTLPPEVEACPPDYSLYPGVAYSLGFSSRGCIRRCAFCVVPTKEGGIRSVATIAELLRPDRGGDHLLALLDNNFLANPDREARFDEIEQLGVTVNFQQGLDIRLVDADVAARLARLKVSNLRRTKPTLHFAFDSPSLEPIVRRGVALLREAGVVAGRLMFYMLCGFDTTFAEDMGRFEILRSLGVDPYVMVYRAGATHELRHFARWVNARVYTVCDWREYRPHARTERQIALWPEPEGEACAICST